MEGQVEGFESRAALEASPWPAYELSSEGRILHVNAAWDVVAASAGGPRAREVLGTLWLSHIRGELSRDWYGRLLWRLVNLDASTSRRVRQLCECNTADRFRLFESSFSAVAAGSDFEARVQVTTRLLHEEPVEHQYQVASLPPSALRGPEGLLFQCGGCRRMRVPGGEPPRWVFVPALVSAPDPQISHVLCAPCRDFYFRRDDAAVIREGP